MAFTMTPAGVLNQIYTTRLSLEDFMTERVKKISRLANIGATGNMQAFWRAFESQTNAGLILANQSAEVVISAQSLTIADGNHSKVTDLMVLGFTRAHPEYPSVVLKATFVIPAPIDAIVNDTPGSIGLPIYTRGIDFATAADPNEALGAMIDFLEDAIVYKDQGGTFHVGGWTYSDSRSRLMTASRIIDGISQT